MKSRLLRIFVFVIASATLAFCGLGGSKTADIKLIPVKSGENYQYIYQEGKIIINPQFSEATIFRNGLALA